MQTAAEVQALGAKVLGVYPLNIADFCAVEVMARALAQEGAFDQLYNVAGISTWGSIETLEIQHWRDLLDINVMGTVHVLKAFTPAMIAAKRGGHIINVSSAAGLFGLPWHSAYSASKFAVRGLSEVLRFDLAPQGIHVSLVCPGAVDTGLVRTINIVGANREHPHMQSLTQQFQKHAVSPEQAARAILKGVRKKRYMVYTSADIAFGYWFTRKWDWPYRLIMKIANKVLVAAVRKSRVQ
jgi:NAD(P)-dependent dehydrogenase (short-subunit alcohol dehydrogenase family)